MSALLPRNKPETGSSQTRTWSRRPWRSLTWQLFFLTILPLTALVLVVAFGSLSVHQQAMRSLVGERDERAVRTAAAALDEQITHRALAIRSLALLADNARVDDLPSILASSDYLLPEFDRGLAFFTTDGKLAASSAGPTPWDELTPPVATLLKDRPSGDTFSLTFNFLSASNATDAVVLILAISPSRDWVAGGAFSVAEMARHTLAGTGAIGPSASIVLVGSDNRLLFEGGSFSDSSEITDHPGVAEALRGESGTQYIMVGREEHVVAYSPVPTLGWAMVLEEPWELVESPTLRTSQLAPLVLVPVLILAIIALWFGARQIVKPLQNLESRAARLAWGNFRAIEEPVGGIEEIRQLQDELIHMTHKVQSAQESLHGYIGAITAAQEDERRRLARELHDDTIQALVALKQRVQLTQLAQNDEQENKSLNEIVVLTEQTIENLRRLTRALRPIYLEDLGLVTALEMLTRETGQTTGISVQFERQGAEKRLEPAVELALYRMVQEALSNVTRHSNASHATLAINYSIRSIILQVMDNGKGFDVPKSPAEFAPSGHFGLLGLYERADLIGAALEIQSTRGKGTQLKVTLPIDSSD